ncbi:MAG: hypothetical protein WD069_18675 [Planctomycetales bacterium]
MKSLWNDECGAVTTIELLIYGTIGGLGIIVGVANLRDAVVAEFTELANAILHLNQGYSVGALANVHHASAGMSADDTSGFINLRSCSPVTIVGECDVDVSVCN